MSKKELVSDMAFKAAVDELSCFIIRQAGECLYNGWSFLKMNEAPETWEELKKCRDSFFIPIASYGQDTSIYGERINTYFRFWHDVCHIENNLSFSYEDEIKVSNMHIKQAEDEGLSKLAIAILKIDTIGQTEYYKIHKKFIDNQLAFVQTCLQVGIANACRLTF